MKKITLLRSALVLCVLAAAFMAPAARAKPNAPITAAVVERALGCGVRDAAGNYHYDPNCEYMQMARRDRDGALVYYTYQDHGRLPDGAPRPASNLEIRTPLAFCIGGYYEQITPGGEYRSECRFREQAFTQ